MSQLPQQDPHEQRIIQQEIVRTPTGVDYTSVEHRVLNPPTPAEQQWVRIVFAKRIVWFVMWTLVSLIFLRFVLVAMGAYMDSGFGRFLRLLTQPFVYPFLALFGEYDKALSPGPDVVYGYLIAMAVYLLLGWAIARIVGLVMSRPPRTPQRPF